MSEPLARSPRQVNIADHLWETLATMSHDMGVDRDSLINQALFALARQNGYSPTPTPRAAAVEAPTGLSTPFAPTAAAAAPYVPPAPEPEPAPRSFAPAPMPVPEPESVVQVEEAPAPEPIIAAPEPPAPSSSKYISSLPSMDPVVFDDPLPPLNAPMPNIRSNPPAPAPHMAAPEPELQLSEAPAPAAAAESAGVLVLYAEGRAVDRVSAPRFLIGRGKHCDLIINSGKVSREHAAIVREGDSYFIEDLGSSNGTWFDKKRITRRQITSGDEYFVCSEKITCRIE